MRGIVALVLMLVLGTGAVARALACDSGAAAPAAATGVTHDHHTQHGGGSPAPEAPAEGGDAALQCCQAMTSCSTSGLASSQVSVAVVGVVDRVLTSPFVAPLSRERSPEPPPPRG